MSFLSRLDWRFATKQFDPEKKVSSENVEKIMNAIRMAPTSFGLQPFHVIIVENPETRKAIRAAAWDQSQVTDASSLLVFCARTDLIERVDQYVDLATGGDAEKKAAMQGYTGMMHGSVDNRPPEAKLSWAGHQAYLALGFGLAAAAELEIDSCPMEGFDSAVVNKILELPAHMTTLAFMPIGYRAAEPKMPKVRFSKEDLFSTK